MIKKGLCLERDSPLARRASSSTLILNSGLEDCIARSPNASVQVSNGGQQKAVSSPASEATTTS